ncbi:hypothetical protein [Streptomyces sp. NPDC055085]
MFAETPLTSGTHDHPYFQWFTLLFLGVTLVAGAAYRAYRKRAVAPEAAAAVPASYA